MAMRLDASALAFLESRPDVASVEEDSLARPHLASTTQIVGTPAIQNYAYGYSYDGGGQTIAILDTGVDNDHPFINGIVDGGPTHQQWPVGVFSDPSTFPPVLNGASCSVFLIAPDWVLTAGICVSYVTVGMPIGFYEMWPLGSREELQAVMSGSRSDAPVRVQVHAGENEATLTFASVP